MFNNEDQQLILEMFNQGLISPDAKESLILNANEDEHETFVTTKIERKRRNRARKTSTLKPADQVSPERTKQNYQLDSILDYAIAGHTNARDQRDAVRVKQEFPTPSAGERISPGRMKALRRKQFAEDDMDIL